MKTCKANCLTSGLANKEREREEKKNQMQEK